MNARELLKEARAELAKAHDHLMELTAKLPMQYFGLVDGNIIQAEDCLIGQLDAYLAAPSESAMEVVEQLQSGRHRNIVNEKGELLGHDFVFDLHYDEAAALIDGYTKRVPRAMLDEYAQAYFQSYELRIDQDGLQKRQMDSIAAKHGYKVEG